jgi:hypothetical protein
MSSFFRYIVVCVPGLFFYTINTLSAPWTRVLKKARIWKELLLQWSRYSPFFNSKVYYRVQKRFLRGRIPSHFNPFHVHSADPSGRAV